MAEQTKSHNQGGKNKNQPIIIEMQPDRVNPVKNTADSVNQAVENLMQATQTVIESPIQIAQDSAAQLVESSGILGKRAAKAAIKTFLARREKANKSPINAAIENKTQQVFKKTKNTLKQVRDAVDPRIVAGGLAGLTAGEIVGGAVGGVSGAVVAGPAGAVVGAQVGGFTAGMLGLKLGADAVYDHLESKRAGKASAHKPGDETSRKTSVGRFLQIKTGERIGEIAGLTSGAALGLVIAGPAGGLVGAVIGEALGGHVAEDLNKPKSNKKDGQNAKESVNHWLDRFGKNTAGEAASVLVAGSVGSIFGPGGRLVGHRIGLIVGKRVEWHKLEPTEKNDPPARKSVPIVISAPNKELEFEGHRKTAASQTDPTQSPEEQADRETITSPPDQITADPPLQFTSRQLEVIKLLSQGFDTIEIAEQLGITTQTVKVHKRNIYKKIKASSNPDAVYVALELVPDSPVY